MPKHWVGCAAENFRASRPSGLTPAAIVVHRSGGSLSMLGNRFADPASSLSAHYGIGLDGTIEQYVADTDTAFHAGVVVNPSWPGLRPRVNPNFYTIGVEHEAEAADTWPEAQRAASASLMAEIATRWSIPLGRDTLVRHSAIRASVRCPPASFPLDEILDRARGHAVTPAAPSTAIVRTIVNTNVRKGAPHRQAPVVRILLAGTDVVVTAYTDAGERVNGNAFWYSDAAGNFFWAGATNVPIPDALDAGAAGIDSSPIVGSTDEMGFVTGTVPSPTESDGVAIDRTSLALPATEYYAETTRKDLIVLHFTAGTSARSAVDTWRSRPEHVATAYVVEIDGTVYEVFPPSCWAYHLGVKGATVHERRSIGIEIANVGPLQRGAGNPAVLNWWPNGWTQKCCTLDESAKYVESEYRGMRYFAVYPDVQVDAVGRLVRHLCERFGIDRRIPAASQRLAYDPASFAAYKGIATHANFRKDKWDVGPAFNWDKLGV